MSQHMYSSEKWVPMTDRVPDAEGPYVVRTVDRLMAVAEWKYGGWRDHQECEIFAYWLPLPPPPEGDMWH